MPFFVAIWLLQILDSLVEFGQNWEYNDFRIMFVFNMIYD
ncbi:protein of unknown function [Ruminococcaceae bacterium BL-4]|nr:protein of unknown function [Ruminococcaceae bacterium BL-4]